MELTRKMDSDIQAGGQVSVVARYLVSIQRLHFSLTEYAAQSQ